MAEKNQILIIDDDVLFAEGLSDVLIEKGYKTAVTYSGNGAFEAIKETDFEVILLDIKMPIMNGVQVYKRIKEMSPQTPVIMMTAFSMEDLVKDALKEGVYGVLYKPLDIDRIVKVIEKSKLKSLKIEGKMVLVVDDDPGARQTLQDILKDKGYVVTLAKDGEEAINIVKQKPQDIMFIDMKLPVLNGFEIYSAIREINPEIVAVMMTAYRDEAKELIEQALEKGAYNCLYKPFDPKEAVDIIEEIVKKGKTK